MGLIFLLALVLAAALYWWQSGMVPFWDSILGEDPANRADRVRMADPPAPASPPAPTLEQKAPEFPKPDQRRMDIKRCE